MGGSPGPSKGQLGLTSPAKKYLKREVMGSDARMRVRLAGQGVSEELAIKLRPKGQQGLRTKGLNQEWAW